VKNLACASTCSRWMQYRPTGDASRRPGPSPSPRPGNRRASARRHAGQERPAVRGSRQIRRRDASRSTGRATRGGAKATGWSGPTSRAGRPTTTARAARSISTAAGAGFDRKAVSGFVTLRPGHPTVYSFHLNDAFQFQKSFRIVEEQMGNKVIDDTHPRWYSTAFWYSLPAQPADRTEPANASRLWRIIGPEVEPR